MSKQDRQGVRTAQDLERKYNFSSMQKAIEMSAEGLFKTNATLDNFVSAVVRNFSEMRSELDSVAEVWFYSGVPTLENEPASTWDDQQEHIGDLYYDEETGFAYRFTPIGWAQVADSDTVYALALANTARDTQDDSRRVFIETPTPPYSIGDLWLDDDTLYICQIEKADGEAFESVDFIHYSKYIEDAVVVHGDEIRENTEKIKDVETIAKQTAGKFEWIVKSGDSETNFTLTDRMAYLMTDSLVVKAPDGTTTVISGGKMDIDKIFAQDIEATGRIFGATLIGNLIKLGEKDTSSVIELCGGVGKISYLFAESDGVIRDCLNISGENVEITSEEGTIGIQNTCEVGSASWENELTLDFQTIELESLCKTSGKKASITLDTSTALYETSGLYLKADEIQLNATNYVQLPKKVGINGLDKNGNSLEMLRIGEATNGEPICIVGDGLFTSGVGYGYLLGGTDVYLKAGNSNSGVRYNQPNDCFIPVSNNATLLGNSAYKWEAIYASNATIQTSDAREKENIIPLGASPIMMLSLDDEATQYDIHSELFDRLIPVQYNYINGNGRICYGLVAQQVAEVMDELGIGEDELDLVHHDYWKDEETGEEKDSYGLAYANLIAMLIHEVQKLKTEVATLKAS